MYAACISSNKAYFHVHCAYTIDDERSIAASVSLCSYVCLRSYLKNHMLKLNCTDIFPLHLFRTSAAYQNKPKVPLPFCSIARRLLQSIATLFVSNWLEKCPGICYIFFRLLVFTSNNSHSRSCSSCRSVSSFLS